MVRILNAVLVCAWLVAAGCGGAEKTTEPVVYPLDRAVILAGAKFDIKVEFAGIIDAAAAKVTLNSKSLSEFFGRSPAFIEKEDSGAKPIEDDIVDDDKDADLASALILRDCVLNTPGTYTLAASDGTHSAKVTWEVYKPAEKRTARNVILMIGDGMSLTHRTAARALSKGIKEGKHGGKLAMDSMPRMALIGTSGVDNFVTDSANSAHAYTTGHKSSNAALGVYADRTKNTFDDPRVENLGYLAKRMNQMSVGIVTTSEVQDATPASFAAHTRSRAEKAAITDFLLEMQPEVLLGGGRAYFMSKMGPNRKLYETDYLTRYKAAGYTYVSNAAELGAAREAKTARLLGLFHPTNMDGVLDRKFLQKGTVAKFPDQPGLEEMTRTALEILSRNEKGFVLLVESALIDKFSHRLDWERAVMDTIMFDKTVAIVKEFAEKNNDTLVLVTSDHGHCVSIAGVIDDNRNKSPDMRDKLGGGYPNYVDADGDGYPDSLDVSRRLGVFFAAFPSYYETFRPKLDGPFTPSELQKKLPPKIVGSEKYKDLPGAWLREGNLPRTASAGVHAADDVILTAMGPGSERVSGFMDNTEVFQIIAHALGLGNVEEKK